MPLLLARLLSNPGVPKVQLHNVLILSTYTSTEPQATEVLIQNTLLLVKVLKNDKISSGDYGPL